MAVKQEADLIDESIPGSIPDVVKIETDPALLDPDKTEGRRLRELLLDIWNTLFFNVRDLVQRLTLKADIDPATGKIKTSQLPDAILGAVIYKGAYNAGTNTPALAAASAANKGHYYITNAAGVSSVNGLEYAIGDWIISNGEIWDKVDNTTAQLIASVFGRTGPILATKGDYNADLVTFTPADATKWTAGTDTVKAALEELLTKAGAKQDKLTFDLTPTLNSVNPVTSDGIKKAIDAVNTGSSNADFSSYTEMLNGEADTDILAVQKASKAKVKWSLGRLKTYLYASLGFVKTINNTAPDANGNVNVAAGNAGATTFTGLTDTPDAYTAAGGKIVAVKPDLSGLEFIDKPTGSGTAATTFLALTDTPDSFAGNALKPVRVNAAGNALEFAPDKITLEFFFDKTLEPDPITGKWSYERMITSEQAATFTTIGQNNSTNIVFSLGGVVQALPFAVFAGQTLKVECNRSVTTGSNYILLSNG